MTAARRLARAWLVLAACAAGSVGCAGAAVHVGGTGSGGSNGCQTIDCLAPASLSPTWLFEIDPPGSSAAAVAFRAAPTAGTGLTLAADAQSTVTVTFSGPKNVPAPSSATAIVTYPSPLAGGPPLTAQAPAAPVSSTDVTATVTVPSLWLSNPATLTLVPLPPADQQTPPYTIAGVRLDPTITRSIGGDTPDGSNFTISGTLQSASALPVGGFVARAFQGGALVSNAPQTKSTDGSFQLVLPPTVLTAGQPLPPLEVQLTPQSDSVPWFLATVDISNPLPAMFAPFDAPIMLAAYGDLSTFTFQVLDLDRQPVTGAAVQAQATLGTNPYGQTVFARSTVSGDDGVTTLALIPAASYDVTVVPPPGATGATSCLQKIDLGSGGPVQLSRSRTEVTGVVRDARGSGVANVAIRATPGPASPASTCAPAPSSTTTDALGSFTLMLDPGTYQFDYDPPAGSAFPRSTDYAVTVDPPSDGMPGLDHPVALGAAGAVTGTVVDASGMKLRSATVRLYDPQCAAPCVPPRLLGQAMTDSNGEFRFAAVSAN